MNRPIVAIDARLAFGTSTGDGSYWTGLIHGLDRIKPELRVLLIANKSRPVGVPEQNFDWIDTGGSSERWWSLVRFPLLARKLGARAIHTQYNLSPLAGRRGVTTIHDVSFFVGPEWFRSRDRLLLQRFVPASVRRAAKVVTVSETSKSEIETWIPAARGKTIATALACPVGIERVERSTAERNLSQSLNLTGPFLLTVGTRWPRKNQALAVRAAELLDESLPHRLIVTGHAGWGEETESNRVQRVGYVDLDTLNCLYSGADLYLAPSKHEGFGLPLLEAFRCGCPVVCSSGGALPEVSGGAGLVVESWSPGDWARTIADALGDSSKLREMREAGFKREAQFSWEETARKTAEIYREVAR